MFPDSFRSSLSSFPLLTHILASQCESLGAPSFGLAGPCLPRPIGTHRKSHSDPILNKCQSPSLILALKTFKELLKSLPHFLQKASLRDYLFHKNVKSKPDVKLVYAMHAVIPHHLELFSQLTRKE